ncbi:uncharacterized protein ARMOST_12268 [Armillaria ostoyae]|uniref:Uncharacterized protein n=1 Tax=Armillaria ostoyae TaxID=47428 RepID=A0A284RJI1_ARMOS|nr:uncharacterized protein ARMOST_12268 [Armillaria ostoyae]
MLAPCISRVFFPTAGVRPGRKEHDWERERWSQLRLASSLIIDYWNKGYPCEINDHKGRRPWSNTGSLGHLQRRSRISLCYLGQRSNGKETGPEEGLNSSPRILSTSHLRRSSRGRPEEYHQLGYKMPN